LAPTDDDRELRSQRQVIYWRLLAATFGLADRAPNVERITGELVDRLGLPRLITDPIPAIDTLIQRYPELKGEFDALEATLSVEPPAGAPDDLPLTDGDLRRDLVYSKMLLNVFGPNTLTNTVSAEQFNQWCRDVARLEACFGQPPGGLRGQGGGAKPGSCDGQGDGDQQMAGESGSGVSGRGPRIDDEQLHESLSALEGDLIRRMALREVLADDALSARLTPSMSLVEQLLLDKGNLSGKALDNARRLIQAYVDQLAEVLKTQVLRAVRGRVDRSVPPKRVFRNLDMKRTVWKNLPNYNPEDRRLYVDRLYYRRNASKEPPKRLIVVVDQSGSMVDAMVQTAILASIFASLPRVDVHLIAFDTNVIDLTDWVHDPFAVLMRTNLGGGNDGPKAMVEALAKVAEPRQTMMVWISDFYEFQNDRPLFEQIKAVKESGVRFIPVGALKSSGYFSLNEWFRARLKEIGLPVLTGDVRKLIGEIKDFLN
jgi:Mg-chelatase subunit ChlD